MENIVSHIWENLDKLFTINFTILAFILTALTILLSIDTKMIKRFRESGYFNDVVTYYKKSIHCNFISGSILLLFWIVKYEEYKNFQIIIALILFITSLYYTYKAYKFLIYFVERD